MKFISIFIISYFFISCKKNNESNCKDCELIREFKTNTLLPQKYGEDTLFVYDIITTNYCSNNTKQYFFESNTFYKRNINECLEIKCTTDSKGTQKCEIE